MAVEFCLSVAPNRTIFSKFSILIVNINLFRKFFKKYFFFSLQQVDEIKKIFPNMQLDWIHCGHLVHLEKPHEFLASVTKFLNA